MMNMNSGGPWGVIVTEVTETGTSTWRKPPRDGAEWTGPTMTEGHGPVFLGLEGQILAGMQLEEGMEFRVALMGRDATVNTPHRVAGRTRIADLSGRQHEVWAVEVLQDRSGWLTTYYVSDQAPFYFGSETKHIDSGQVRFRERMKSFQRLND